MKKASAFVLSLVMVVLTVFSSCGKTDEDTNIRGYVSNNVYVNEFADLKFSPGPSWTFTSDGEILKSNGVVTGEKMSAEEKQSLIDRMLLTNRTVYDMLASDSTVGDCVQVLFENMLVTGSVNAEDAYAKDLIKQLTSEEQGYTAGETVLEEFAGETYLKVPFTKETSALKLELTYLLKKKDTYLIVVSISSLPELGSDYATLASMFKKASE